MNTWQTKTVRVSGVCCALVLLLLVSLPQTAPACDALLADRAPLFEATVNVQGHEKVSRTVQLPASATALVFAAEEGIDVSLEIARAGRSTQRADNPIARTGVQRAVVVTRDAGTYEISVAGKEHANARGRVAIRAVLAAGTSDVCVANQRTLAAADAAYAAADFAATGAGQGDAASSYRAAANTYGAVADALSKRPPSPLLAQARHAQAAVFSVAIHDWAKASASAVSAVQTYAALNDEYGRARAQLVHAEAEIEIASAARPRPGSDPIADPFDNVRQELQSLIDFHARRGEYYDEATALNNSGITFHMQLRYDEALHAYGSALRLYEQLNETAGEGRVLQNMAVAEYDLGRLPDSVGHYAQILQLLDKDDDPALYASVLCNSALSNWAIGQYDVALRQLGEALPIQRAAGDRFWEAAALQNIGQVYDALGDRPRALEFYQQALALRTPELDTRGRVSSLRTVANILRSQGHLEQALEMHQEALELASGAARKRVQVQIARDLIALGRQGEAGDPLNAVIDVREAGDDVVRARALAVRGQSRATSRDFAGAESDFNAAILVFHSFEQAEDELEALVGLGHALRGRGAVADALTMVDKALALAEEVRLQSSNPELRATLLQPLRPAFDLKISLLAQRHFAPEMRPHERARLARLALETSELARARALADFQTLDLSAPGVPPELAARRQTLYREIAARRFRLAAIVDRAGTQDSRVQTIRSDIASLHQELDRIDARIGAASAAALASQARRKSTIPSELRAPARDVSVVEYWLGADEAYAWVVDRDNVAMIRLGSARAITDTARAFQTALHGYGTVPAAERLSLASQLYDQIVRPLGARALANRRLIFLPDGALHYVPFAALRAGTAAQGQFLVQGHDVAVAPSIRMFLQRRVQSASTVSMRDMLLVADPVYTLGDARLARFSESLPEKPAVTKTSVLTSWLRRGGDDPNELARLPGTAQEAATIASLLPAASIDRLEGFGATRDRFLKSGLEHYRFIHIASHAISDSEIPQASALILSRFDASGREIDGNVLAADFVQTQLNAQTVVLSACDTAIGKDIAGEGLIGLRYVVLARGAQSVISSLWPVLDQATAKLMSDFYTLMLRGDPRVEAAFSEAMRMMIAGRLKDPSLWGGFALTLGSAQGPQWPMTTQ